MTDSTNHKLAHLGFQRVEPTGSLRSVIDSYWFINATCQRNTGYQEYLHPDGGTGLIFNYGSVLSFDQQSKATAAFLDGTNTRTIQLGLSDKIKAAGIRFKPAGASVFFNIPMSELKNQHLDISDINSKHITNLFDTLVEEKNLKNKVSLIENALNKARLTEKTVPAVVAQAISLVKRTRGALRVKTLAEQLNLSQRKLERLFKTQLGMSPVEFAKTIRVEHARELLKTSDASFADIAYQLHFHDQAHFTKYFKAVVGITPGEYRQRSCLNNNVVNG